VAKLFPSVYTLATCNTGDFAWIEELKVFNPLDAG